MATLSECQKAMREVKKELSSRFGPLRFQYKTSSSWSDLKYVELKANLMILYSVRDYQQYLDNYNKAEIEDAVVAICEKYGIPKNKYGIHLTDYYLEITLFSDEPR